MGNFLEYNPEQAYLLPPTVREVLGEGPVDPAGLYTIPFPLAAGSATDPDGMLLPFRSRRL